MRLRFLRVLLAALVPMLPLTAQSRGGDGFLFSAPHATLAIRGGFARPNASSDVFSFVTERLTVNRGDFGGFSLATDLAFRVHSRVDLLLGTGVSTREARSEYRDFVDLDDLPIEQQACAQDGDCGADHALCRAVRASERQPRHGVCWPERREAREVGTLCLAPRVDTLLRVPH